MRSIAAWVGLKLTEPLGLVRCQLQASGQRGTDREIERERELSAPKSQRFLRFAIAMPIAVPRNRAISETRQSNVALRFKGAMESR